MFGQATFCTKGKQGKKQECSAQGQKCFCFWPHYSGDVKQNYCATSRNPNTHPYLTKG